MICDIIIDTCEDILHDFHFIVIAYILFFFIVNANDIRLSREMRCLLYYCVHCRGVSRIKINNITDIASMLSQNNNRERIGLK